MSTVADHPAPETSITKAKQAAEKALGFLNELFPAQKPFTFEEVRHQTHPSPRWLLTFSYPDPKFPLPNYKVVELDSESLHFIQASNR